MLVYWRATVADGGPPLNQYGINVFEYPPLCLYNSEELHDTG